MRIIILLAIGMLYACDAFSYIFSSGSVYNCNELSYIVNKERHAAAVHKRDGYASAYLEKEVFVPSVINVYGVEYPVIGIDDNAFSGCTSIEKIVVSEGVEIIESGAFNGCTALKEVDLPSTLTSIGYAAFGGCNSLQSITLPEGLLAIGTYAFEKCTSLQSITIPRSVTFIDQYVFSKDSSFKEIYYKGGCVGWSKLMSSIKYPGNELLNAKVIYLNGLTYNGEEFDYEGICYRTIDAEDFKVEVIPIGWSYVGNITIPASFNYCSLDWKVAGIAAGVFDDCPYLQSICFTGTRARWEKLDIGEDNAMLDTIPIIFDYKAPTPSGNNELYMAKNKIVLGSRVNLELSLKNKYPVSGFQFVMKLPAGLSVPTDENGHPFMSLCDNRVSSQLHNISRIEALPENSYLVICASDSRAAISDDDGSILNLCVESDESIVATQAKIELSDVTITTEDNALDRISKLSFPLEVIEKSYKLTYIVDGVTYKQYEVDYDTAVTPEPYPVKEGHTFIGWDNVPETMPANDVEVTGTFETNSYKITFIVDGEIDFEYEDLYGEDIRDFDQPTKYGYTFVGWSPLLDATVPAHDVTYTAVFKANSYKLTYIVNGEIYKEYDVDYESEIIPEAAPSGNGFEFSGWSEIPVTMPAHDVIIYGTMVDAIIGVKKSDNNSYRIYSVDGTPSRQKTKGIKIIKYADGSSRIVTSQR